MVGASGLRARLRVRRDPGDTVEDRLEALEKNFTELEREHDERTREFEVDVGKLNDRINAMRTELGREHEEREEQRRAFVRRSVQLQTGSLVLFVFGVFLSVLGTWWLADGAA